MGARCYPCHRAQSGHREPRWAPFQNARASY